MGCSASNGKYVAKDAVKDAVKDNDTVRPAETETAKDGGAEPGMDSGRLIDEIAQRVSSIRGKAEEYRAQLQQQVVEIEQERAALSPSAGGQENGVVIASYKPSDGAGGTALMEALEGERLEIIVRDAGGWAYCRRKGTAKPGWLPAARVVEIAALVADHDGEGAEGLLSLKVGDTVEVVSRHYSGWAFCREWTGPPLPGCPDERREGWVTDAYLEDLRSEAMLASKWHRLVLQALDQVVSSSKELEAVLAQAKSEDWRNELSVEWMGQCVEFGSWLTTELQSISQAVSQREQSSSSNGAQAIVTWDVPAGGPTELAVSKGDRVLILDAENADWAWCRSQASGREGWVPQNVLQVEGGDGSNENDGQLSYEDLPEWIREGERCQWWSASGGRYCDVSISEVDKERREVKVVFAVDKNCWKCIGFDHFAQPREQWLLQPFGNKDKELQSQLPEWLQVGGTAYWWSTSQKRCLSVTIRDLCFKRKMVSVSFDIDKRVRKSMPFFELIDDPKNCLLQRDRAGHAWRAAAAEAAGGGAAPGEGATASTELDEMGSPSDGGIHDDAFRQTAAHKLADLFEDMQHDLGDMIGADGIADAEAMAEASAALEEASAALEDVDPRDVAQAATQGSALTPQEAPAPASASSPADAGAAVGSAALDSGCGDGSSLAPAPVPPASQGLGAEARGTGGGEDAASRGGAEGTSGDGSRAPSKPQGGLAASSPQELDVQGALLQGAGGSEAPPGVAGMGTALADSIDIGALAPGSGAPGESAEQQPSRAVSKVSDPQASRAGSKATDPQPSRAASKPGGSEPSRAASEALGEMRPSRAASKSTAPEPPGRALATDADVDQALADLAAIHDDAQYDAEPPVAPSPPAPVGGAAVAQPPHPVVGEQGLRQAAMGEGGSVDAAPSGDSLTAAPPAAAVPPAAPPPMAVPPPRPSVEQPPPPGAAAPEACRVGGGDGSGLRAAAAWGEDAGQRAVPEPLGLGSGAPAAPAADAAPPVGIQGSNAALPPAVGDHEKGVTWAEPCANTPPAKRRGSNGSELEYTNSEQDLMENIGEREGEGGTLFSTMDRELMQELGSLETPHGSPHAVGHQTLTMLNASLISDGAVSPAHRGGGAPAPAPRQAFMDGPLEGAGSDAPEPTGPGRPAREPRNVEAAWGTMNLAEALGPGDGPSSGGAEAAPRTEVGAGAGPRVPSKPRHSAWGGDDEDPVPTDVGDHQGGPAQGGPPVVPTGPPTVEEVLRVVSPDAWDSEGEGGGRAPPDLPRLAAAWPGLQGDFDASSQAAEAHFDGELAGELAEAEAAIAAKVEEVRGELEERARAAEAKLDPQTARQHRSLVWGVVNRAEGAREARQRARRRRLELRRRRATAQREAVSRALGPEPSSFVAATFAPDAKGLEELSTADAVAEVAESAQGIFRALQVVILRPPATGTQQEAAAAQQNKKRSQSAWEDGDAQQAHGRAFRGACEVAARSLRAAVDVLFERLTQIKEETPPLDEHLESVVKNEDGLTKAQKREKAMFEGQQEYSYERSLGLRLQEQVTRQEAGSKEALDRVEAALQRRFRRRSNRDRPRALQDLGALQRAVSEAGGVLAEVRQEHDDKAEAEAVRLEAERRNMQEQTQAMLLAAMVVRQEKGRMNKAWASTNPKDRAKLMRVALRRVRRLNHDMKNLQVINELKQKHSVLLYSLRMLEARLQTECPADAKYEMEEGRLEETPEQRQQLDEAGAAFEEQLARDIDALREAHAARAARAVERRASQLRRAAEESLADALPAAQGAFAASQGAAVLAAAAVPALAPFAQALARLRVEAFRHRELERGPGDASGFGPKRIRLDAAVDFTVFELRKLRAALDEVAAAAPAGPAPPRDAEWERAISSVEASWQGFCERYPLLDAAGGSDTPRSDAEGGERQASMLATETLIFDDLEMPDAAAEVCTPPGAAAGGRRGRPTTRGAPTPAKPAPTSPTSRPATRAGAGARPPAPSSKPFGATGSLGATGKLGPPMPPSRSGSNAGLPGSQGKNATALLAQLDELNKTMDTTLKKAGGTFSQPHGAAPSRKPGVPTARRTTRQA